MKETILLFAMLFCHIMDDFYLQPGILSNIKQKSWWEKNAPDDLYKHDYLIALFIHALSWTIAIHIPVFVFMWISEIPFVASTFFFLFVTNWVTHAVVDHMKANKKKINLIEDQMIHMAQIILTWLVYILL